MSPEDPNFLERQCESLEPDHPAFAVWETTMLRKISFEEMSQ